MKLDFRPHRQARPTDEDWEFQTTQIDTHTLLLCLNKLLPEPKTWMEDSKSYLRSSHHSTQYPKYSFLSELALTHFLKWQKVSSKSAGFVAVWSCFAILEKASLSASFPANIKCSCKCQMPNAYNCQSYLIKLFTFNLKLISFLIKMQH